MNEEVQAQKLRAELEKIKIESRFIKWTFFGQLFNSSAIITTAVLVLIFYQRPQNDQMALTRQADQEMRISSLIPIISGLANKSDQIDAFKSLVFLYPNHPALRAALDYAEAAKKSSDKLKKPTNSLNSDAPSKKSGCEALFKQISELETAYAKDRIFETQIISGKSAESPLTEDGNTDYKQNEYNKMIKEWRTRSKSMGCDR